MFPCLHELSGPADQGARIWLADLRSISESEHGRLRAVLSEGEAARAARFHFDRDRSDFVATRGLLRHLLGDALGVSAEKIFFEYGPHGKPEISESSLRFNISHSHGRALIALATNRRVGIDLEANQRIPDGSELDDLAKRILSPREYSVWKKLADETAGRAAFFRAWTRKEAFAKGRGTGVFDRLQTVELILDAATPRDSIAISASDDGSSWQVSDLAAPNGFTAAMALEDAS